MDPEKDLLEAAKDAKEDFYELLGVQFESSEAEIKRAYRMTSLKYHPDKHPGKLDVVEKFHLLAIARDVLLDPKAKAAYDAVRLRRKERELQNQMLDGRRRQMKEDLERREGAFKRKREEDLSAEQRLQKEVERLAEDGKRRRKEREERLSKELQKEEEEASFMEDPPEVDAKPKQSGGVSEFDRTVKVRWLRQGEQATWGKDKITDMFSRFGDIDSIVIGKDKKIRLEGEKHRKAVAMVFIIYASIVAAHAAVEDGKQIYPSLESVVWANKEPDIKSPLAEEIPSAPSTPVSTPNKSFRASFTGGLGKGPNGIGGTPSFSFSPKTPSLEEVTLMRLKQAEKRRLEEQIRMREASEEGEAL
ncbi:DnaJ-domain-containing protein [Delitschia confertaspora ATCC 74209]|uniref:DnaJ-domain-containing protein n=1 Tax=Delitschia confertaspora ATCC 74209 TaxID=1513339 RepID=A0A9P4MXY8_9PLEO|nr:DnaJ-domain-containing protein [Delitschia confertaspora ATCC 74209]